MNEKDVITIGALAAIVADTKARRATQLRDLAKAKPGVSGVVEAVIKGLDESCDLILVRARLQASSLKKE